ncbi:MAG: XdhC family protein [Methylocystis sp.]|jgi:xanthine dehydrogenase accessory factor|nr:XdhC family protein [Methylocystis sp.]MCA3584269.1 XdhC family protein [Methylocystis sp.]MCA3588301.1 XdhC family protein [Methylocystis sp.]MCA3593423.1 XdhC family protein [Methylocystis sp.]
MKLELLASLNAERAARRAAVLVTDVENGTAELVKAADLARLPLAGTALGEAVAAAIRQGKSAMVEVEGRKLFLTVHVPPVKLVVTGAVHISQAMAPIARTLGLDMIVVDPRTAFATPERFPDVPLIADWPDVALPPLSVDAYTAFVALTHDPKIDDPALQHALKAECFYIGALGSRKTHAGRVARLAAAGFAPEAIARIHAPIGLDIGAVSPAEIAVAILGEIIASLRKGAGGQSKGAAA